jgi:hypothetical protein
MAPSLEATGYSTQYGYPDSVLKAQQGWRDDIGTGSWQSLGMSRSSTTSGLALQRSWVTIASTLWPIEGGIGHDLPQEAPVAFADAMLKAGRS